jgi:DNA-binding transcriptional regulator YdaS (Cro superfamily)
MQMHLSALVSDFRQFVAAHLETKKLAFARTIGVSPSGLSAILSGANKPSATQALAMLNVIRGGSSRIVYLQENAASIAPHGDPRQRIELNDRNADYLENFSRRVDAVFFDSNDGRVAREGASDDPANGTGDVTDIANRKAGNAGTDDPSFANLLSQLDNLYKIVGDILATQTIKKAVPNKGSAGTIPRQPNQKFSC